MKHARRLKKRLKAAWVCLTGDMWLLSTCHKGYLQRFRSAEDVDIAKAVSRAIFLRRQTGINGLDWEHLFVRCEMIDTIMNDPSVLVVSENETGRIMASHSLTYGGGATLEDLAGAAERYGEEEKEYVKYGNFGS